MENNITTLTVILIILIVLSAYFSAAETSFSAINRIRLKNMASSGNKRAQETLNLADEYDSLLSTILIGNNIVNIASASIATVIFTHYYGTAGVALSTIFLTIIILIFGEISPKSLAKESPEKFAMFATPFLRILIWILTPINLFFVYWKKFLSKIFKVTDNHTITEEELITIIDEAQKEGGINEEEGSLIRSAVEFNELEVSDVLTPRVNIIAVEINADDEKINQLFMESGYSRLPIYEGHIDNIIGVLLEKNFHHYLYSKNDNKSLKDIILPVTWVYESFKLPNLLKLLQNNQSHMAVITDEYGGTKGIVTLEDIIEEIVGEIWDEHDEITQEIIKINDYEYLIDGSTNLDKVFELFNLDIDHDVNTIGGFVIDNMGKIPSKGETFNFENLQITIKKTDHRRVLEVLVKHIPINSDKKQSINKE